MTFTMLNPRFPQEVEHRIFTQAAHLTLYHARSLALVAKRVKILVDPIIYRIVAIHSTLTWPPLRSVDTDSAEILLEALQKHGKHVRHLLLSDTSVVNADILTKCLELCPNVVDLALLTFTTDLKMIKICAGMKLIRLSISLDSCLHDIDWENASKAPEGKKKNGRGQEQVFRKDMVDISLWQSTLTHLDILDDNVIWDEYWSPVFRTFKHAVTHLSMPVGFLEEDVEVHAEIFFQMRKLKILAFVEPLEKYYEDEAEESGEEGEIKSDGEDVEIDDWRARNRWPSDVDPSKWEDELFEKETVQFGYSEDTQVPMVCLDFPKDWLKAAFGGKDMWDMWDEEVAKAKIGGK